MKKIKMLETSTGYPDGITKQYFDKGCIYSVPDNLADAFLSLKWAENVLEIETPEKEPELMQESINPDEIETPEKPKGKKGK